MVKHIHWENQERKRERRGVYVPNTFHVRSKEIEIVRE